MGGCALAPIFSAKWLPRVSMMMLCNILFLNYLKEKGKQLSVIPSSFPILRFKLFSITSPDDMLELETFERHPKKSPEKTGSNTRSDPLTHDPTRPDLNH